MTQIIFLLIVQTQSDESGAYVLYGKDNGVQAHLQASISDDQNRHLYFAYQINYDPLRWFINKSGKGIDFFASSSSKVNWITRFIFFAAYQFTQCVTKRRQPTLTIDACGTPLSSSTALNLIKPVNFPFSFSFITQNSQPFLVILFFNLSACSIFCSADNTEVK
ncbi:hypothetical protein V4B17_05175 [Bartonella sp. B23]